MKTIKSVNVGSFALYGAVLAAFWTFVLACTTGYRAGSSVPNPGSLI